MSAPSLGNGNKLFRSGIQQDFVELLQRDLKRFNALRKNSFSGEVEEMQSTSTKIQKEVEEITNFLTATVKWENQVFNSFFKIRRVISEEYPDEDEFLSRMDQKDKYLEGIFDEIKKLKEVVREIGKKISDKPQQDASSVSQTKQTTFQVGESSDCSMKDSGNKKNDGFVLDDVWLTEKLNTPQRDCLQSLAIFPENTELKKRLLINWWIGLGILPFEGNASAMENQSTEILSQLERMNILKPKRIREHNRVIDSYTIDFTIHEHLISDMKAKGRIVSEDTKENDPLHFYKDDNENMIAVLNLNQKHLINSKYISKPTIKVARLDMRHCTDFKETIYYAGGIKFFENMGENMTYLSLRGVSNIEELPQSFGKIRGLKILDLKYCHSLQKLPKKQKSIIHAALCKDDTWFKELRHLDITGCCLLDHMPKWVCELSNLQVLKGAVFNGRIIPDQSRLKDLSKLQKLTKLSIKIIHPQLLSDVDCTGLKTLSNLLVLTIIWNIRESETKKQSRDNVKDSENNSGKGVEHIPNIIEGQVVVTEKQSRENAREKSSNSRSSGKKPRNVNKDKMVDRKRQSKNIMGENEDCQKIPIICFPENLEKLDIRCYPNAESPELSNAAKLKNLKRLYIRGGKLARIGDDPDWQVEILRLRFLEFLNLDWYELGGIFTKLECVEYKECPRLKFFPIYTSCWSKEIDGPFPCRSGPFNDDEPIPPQKSDPFEDNKQNIFPPNPGPHRVMLGISRTFTSDTDIMIDLDLTLRGFSSEVPDLVMVLDTRRSMEGEKLAIMKTAVLSFIEELISSPFVRLSIVTFGTNAKGQCGLRLLTEIYRTELEYLIQSLEANGATNAFDGLQMGLKVLKDRRFSRGRPTWIMLISGSNHIFDNAAHALVDGLSVLTFEIGQDYDTTVLESIATKSGEEAFTDISNTNDLREALHKCWMRVLNLEVHDLTLTITPPDSDYKCEVNAGSYLKSVANGSTNVHFGHLLGKEVRTATIQTYYSWNQPKSFKISCSYKFKGDQFKGKWIYTIGEWRDY